MNYRALIQNRRSVRAFSEKKIPLHLVDEIRDYYRAAERLLPDLETELHLYAEDVKAALEGAAGYHQFLVGAPYYLVLLSDDHPHAQLNAGYVMQDMILKLTDMGLDTCWVTFTDSRQIKNALGIESDREVMAIAAFGYGAKTTKRLRLNIHSMSNIDISAKRHYFEPKRSISDMVVLNTWGNIHKLDDHIGFFDDMLWESFYAASLSPSYLNR